MSRAIDFCQEGAMACRCSDGVHELYGYRYGDLGLALDPGNNTYALVHLPSGLSFCGIDWGSFEEPEPACEALVVVHGLKNTWQFLTVDEAAALLPAIREIVERHGGTLPTRCSGQAEPVENDQNGFAEG